MLTPLSPDDCGTLFRPLESEKRIAVAVSGGPDSTALMVLLTKWAKARLKAPDILALTVDHDLRAESHEEAAKVADWAAQLGIPHQTLCWEGPKPRSNIQAEARKARYALMAMACHSASATAIVTAHHLEDQAETFLLRLARGSGVDGLGAMEQISNRHGLKLMRPFLDIPRIRLKASLEAIDHPWLDDPSNENEQFDRIKIRRLQPTLNELGMTADRLAATAKRMRAAQEVLEHAADQLSAESIRLDAAGYCLIRHEALANASQETSLRLLARCLMAISGYIDRPRYSKTEGLLAAIIDDEACRRTFWGCRIVRRRDHIWIWRESGRAGLPEVLLTNGEPAIWDGRFTIRYNTEDQCRKPQKLIVRSLGKDGVKQINQLMPDIPADLKRTFVSFWHENQLVAVPHLDWNLTGYNCEAIFENNLIRNPELVS